MSMANSETTLSGTIFMGSNGKYTVLYFAQRVQLAFNHEEINRYELWGILQG